MRYQVTVEHHGGKFNAFSTIDVEAIDNHTAGAIGLGRVLEKEKWRAVDCDVDRVTLIPGQKIAGIAQCEGYLNIYEHKNGNVLCGGMYQTEEIAKNTSKKGLKAIAHVRWRLLPP